ncbi:MAG: hypothetical protein K2J04_07835, partial [Lachnospiraceae bacterium]|nr:hypothetical protein [Lachnospiraceae bacterium]
ASAAHRTYRLYPVVVELYIFGETVKILLEQFYKMIPFDNLQQGDYAVSHGGFTSEDIGYSFVQQVFYPKF